MTQAAVTATVQDAFWRAAETLMFYHTNPWELDEALTDWGYDMGPCEAQDLLGLEQVLARGAARNVPILPRMVAEGRMGKSGGVGYYRYPGGGGAVIDPLIEDLILEEAWFAKVTRSEVSDAELIEKMHGELCTCCANLLASGTPHTSLQTALTDGLHLPADKAGFILGPL